MSMTRDEIALKILLSILENEEFQKRLLTSIAHPATGTCTVGEMNKMLAKEAWHLADAFIAAPVPDEGETAGAATGRAAAPHDALSAEIDSLFREADKVFDAVSQ